MARKEDSGKIKKTGSGSVGTNRTQGGTRSHPEAGYILRAFKRYCL